VRGEELELELQVFAIGGTAECQSITTDPKGCPNGFSREDTMQVVGTVFAETSRCEGTAGEEGEARLVLWFGEEAGANTHAEVNLVCLEIGFLEIQADAVGERHECEVQIVNVFFFFNHAGRTKVGVGKFRISDLFGCCK